MYISGAKFEENCSNFSGDILDSVFYCLSEIVYDVITLLVCMIQKREYTCRSLKWKKDIPKRKTPFFFTLKRLANKLPIFYFIGTLERIHVQKQKLSKTVPMVLKLAQKANCSLLRYQYPIFLTTWAGVDKL